MRPPLIRPWMRGASPTMSATGRRGLSDANGSWNIICAAQAAAARARRPTALPMSRPLPQHLRRRDGGMMPATMRPSVDLPQPDSPTRPTTSPLRDREIDIVDRAHHRRRLGEAERDRRPADEIGRLAEAARHAAQLDESASGGPAAMPARRSCRGLHGVDGSSDADDGPRLDQAGGSLIADRVGARDSACGRRSPPAD